MTVLSYRHNRFNTEISQVNWQKSCSKNSKTKVFYLFNSLFLFTIILGAIFYVIGCVEMTNYRIDIQRLEKKIQSFEESNSELKTTVNELGAFSNIGGLISQATLTKQNQPAYLSIKQSSAPLGFNSDNIVKNE